MLNKFRNTLEKYANQTAKILIKVGLSPWMVSTIGLMIVLLASYILIINTQLSLITSLILYLIGNGMDALDGAVARLTEKVSKWGGYMDSMIDRIGEAAYILAIAHIGMISWEIAYIYIVSALLISYSRARGEKEGVEMSGIGLMERAERVIGLALAILIYITLNIPMDLLFLIIIILNIITIIQRSVHTYTSLRES